VLQLLLFASAAGFLSIYDQHFGPANQKNTATAYAVTLASYLAKHETVEESSLRTLFDEMPPSTNVVEAIRITGFSSDWQFWYKGIPVISEHSYERHDSRESIVQPVFQQRGDLSAGSAAKLEIYLAPYAFSQTLINSLLAVYCGLNILFLLLINHRLKSESTALLKQARQMLTPESASIKKNSTASLGNMQLLFELQNALEQYLEFVETIQVQAEQNKQNGSSDALSQQQTINQQELQLARKSAVQANRLKNTVIANTSHELLTPLNSIAGFSELLLKQPATSKQNSRYLKLIHDNALYLSSLVNDLVLFADNLNSKVLLQYKTVRIDQLLTSIADTLKDEASKKGLDFLLDTSKVTKVSVNTDPIRLRQIVTNLTVNAIRYTDQGSINISADLDNQRLTIVVSDTGKGIPKDQQQRLFTAFASGKHAVSDSAPGLGLGLGLAIVRNLCSRMGAKIKLQSEINKGTSFTITFPARDTATTLKPESQEAVTLKNLNDDDNLTDKTKILVVDDNAANTLLLKSLLTHVGPTGMRIDTALDGEQALSLVSHTVYDWLFLDVRMSPMDGITLLKKIRLEPAYQSAISTAIACTAHTSDDAYRQLIAAGFDPVVHKPLSTERLTQLLNKNYKSQGVNNGADLAGDESTITASTFFEPALAIKKANGNVDIARQIFEQFVEEVKQCIKYRTLQESNVSRLIDNIHYLNGAAAVACVPVLRAQFETVENQLKMRPDYDNQTQQSIEFLEKHLQDFLLWCEQQPMDTFFNGASDTKLAT